MKTFFKKICEVLLVVSDGSRSYSFSRRREKMLLQQRLTSSRRREGERLLETLEKGGGGVGGRSRGRELLSILATKEEDEKTL